MLIIHLHEIIAEHKLNSWFQPIVNTKTTEILGYEALVRGPSNSPLHSPESLFAVAEECGLLEELENACHASHLKAFIELQLNGLLFLNVCPQLLSSRRQSPELTKRFLSNIGLSPSRVVIELTEHRPVNDSPALIAAVASYRRLGFGVAIDDLGSGYNGLKLWSEMKPNYVKVDRHFIQGINEDHGKRELLNSLLEMARGLDCRVIAEGIETAEEYRVVKELGAPLGQGYFFARPAVVPIRTLPAGMLTPVEWGGQVRVYGRARSTRVTSLAKLSPTIPPKTTVIAAGDLLAENGELRTLPVIENGVPVGIVHRHQLLQLLASRFGRDLYGRTPISHFMDRQPLIVEKDMPVEQLSHLITDEAKLHGVQDFLITDQGRYLGVGTLIDLLREVTELQIRHARYANPLTLLPGNVPINEHIDFLLNSSDDFVICYFDIDHFKPFNDYYGYGRGDMVIRLLAHTLASNVDGERDFVGHIGGDDFIVVFQCPDWEVRCHTILRQFEAEATALFDPLERSAGGIHGCSRNGQPQFFPLISLSAGAVLSGHGHFRSAHDIAAVASEAKSQAKKLPGSKLFVERRFFERDAPALSDSA